MGPGPPAMLCQICKKNDASVHVTEIEHFPCEGESGPEEPSLVERHICERCAVQHKVPYAGVAGNKSDAVWQLLRESARRARAESALRCPSCGMTLAEFRNKGRFGCPEDYRVFAKHMKPLLLRVHNATEHVGSRPPHAPAPAKGQVRKATLSTLRKKLQEAIREEAYESAARLRDQISAMESASEADA